MASPKTFVIQRADLQGHDAAVTLITGGISGIGLQTAQLLHDLNQQNRIIIVDRSSKDQCSAPTAFIHSARVHFVQSDVTNWTSLRSSFEAGIAKFGAIDNVFVNAGINEYGDQFFKDEPDGEPKEPDHRVLNIDLIAASNTVKLAAHYMRHRKDAKKGGSIVMTASLAGYLASTGQSLYSAAKHGLVGLMRALKNDLAKFNIAISVVAPGITLTDMVPGRNAGESHSDWAVRMRASGIPLNDPAEVAMAVVWLMSLGQKSNGKGMLLQAGKVADVEEGIAKNRKLWMGSEMLDLFKGGRNALLIPNKL